MMKNSYNNLVQTKQQNIAKRIIRINSNGPATIFEFIQKAWGNLVKPVTALRAHIFQNTGIQVSRKQAPIFKVLLIVVGGIVLLYKDLKFNLDLSAPANGTSALVALDEDDEEQQTAKPVAYQEETTFLVPTHLKNDDIEIYLERFGKTAVTEMDNFGIPASIKLAQGIIESNAGLSKLATENNNHFGIKCFSRKCAKGHCSNFTDNTHKDFFRKYNSAWECWRAHSKLLANGKYKSLQKHGKDYKAWATGLKKLGYATDKQYDAKLIGVIEKYKLYKYDDI